jgi:ubiquinone biosynthesis protein
MSIFTSGMALPLLQAWLVRWPESRRRTLWRRLRDCLIECGPAFIKVGQVLGARRDLLPDALCDELSLLTDRVPPLKAAQSARLFAACYGSRLESDFRFINYEAVAAGSVAGVYEAMAADGRRVALKLQRPEAAKKIHDDLRIFRAGGRVVARVPAMRNVPVATVVQQVCDAIASQLDFAKERQALCALRDDLKGVPGVWVPAVHEDLSRPQCIAMEFIPDLSSDTMDSLPPALKRRAAVTTMTAMYEMLFVRGFVHCDLHAGNAYYLLSGQTVMLDAGFTQQLSDRMRRLFAEFFLCMSLGRGEKCAGLVLQSAESVRGGADIASFRSGIVDLVARNHGIPAASFSLISFARELFELQRRNGIVGGPELVFPLLALLVIEPMVRALDPELDFQELAKPVINRGLFGHH